MQSTRRAMREDEYAALRSRAGFYDTPESQRYRWRTGYAFPALCVGLTLWGPIIIAIVMNERLPQGLVLALWGASLVALLTPSFWFFRRRARRKDLADEAKRQEQYAADLAAREVDEWRFRVVKAVEADGHGAAGFDFYLELDDERVLVVSEGDLRNVEYDEDGEIDFPTKEVSLTRLPHTGEVLSVEGLGDELSECEWWCYFTSDIYQEHGAVKTGDFLPGPLSRYSHDQYDDVEDDDDCNETARAEIRRRVGRNARH
jgi:hypothetical protein